MVMGWIWFRLGHVGWSILSKGVQSDQSFSQTIAKQSSAVSAKQTLRSMTIGAVFGKVILKFDRN